MSTIEDSPSASPARGGGAIIGKWAKEAERAKRLLTKAVREARAYERRHRERLGIG